MLAHPEDPRYKDLLGKFAVTPLFHAKVPILPAEHANPEKGTGILMVCTFGDSLDVQWWKSSRLPARQIIGQDGRLLDIHFGAGVFSSLDPEKARQNYAQLASLSVKQAQKKVVEMLSTDGSSVDGLNKALVGEPKSIVHPVKFFEKGARPIEFLTTRQWFIRVCDFKQELLEQGRKIVWRPEFMRSRYENWVEGLSTDWCISRQRFFGVPFPVWYPVNKDGLPDYTAPIFANAESLPIDPMIDVPPGYVDSQRGEPHGFVGDPDVMDTWATSALTPQIATGWRISTPKFERLFPMDLRPQAHDIIRTWAFVTILKSWMHQGSIPWKNIALSGWILDPDRKKMSKSKGNVVTPDHLLIDYSSDGVRYWAARARLGVDTAFDDKVFHIGQKLVLKVFNMAKFVISLIEQIDGDPLSNRDIVEPIDCAQIEELRSIIQKTTESFDRFDYATALQVTEDSFWRCCDYYLELVKARAYRDEDLIRRRSAVAALRLSLSVYIRLFAPALPYITEEIWSWYPHHDSESVHIAPWPTLPELELVSQPPQAHILPVAQSILGEIRKAKSVAQKGLTTDVLRLVVKLSPAKLRALKLSLSDIIAAGHVRESGIELIESDDDIEADVPDIQVVLYKDA